MKLTPQITEGTRTFHARQDGDQIAATLVVKRIKEGNPAKITYMYGLAIKGPRDQFSRRVGRQIAFHRLTHNPSYAFDLRRMADLVEAKVSSLDEYQGVAIHIDESMVASLREYVLSLAKRFDEDEKPKAEPSSA